MVQFNSVEIIRSMQRKTTGLVVYSSEVKCMGEESKTASQTSHTAVVLNRLGDVSKKAASHNVVRPPRRVTHSHHFAATHPLHPRKIGHTHTHIHTQHIIFSVVAMRLNPSCQKVSSQKHKRFSMWNVVERPKSLYVLFQRPHHMLIFFYFFYYLTWKIHSSFFTTVQTVYGCMNKFLLNPLLKDLWPFSILHVYVSSHADRVLAACMMLPWRQLEGRWTLVVSPLAWVSWINTVQWQHRTSAHLEHVPSYRYRQHPHPLKAQRLTHSQLLLLISMHIRANTQSTTESGAQPAL